MTTSGLEEPPNTTPPTNLAELRAQILEAHTLTPRRRKDIASALSTLARGLALPPEAIAADPVSLRDRLRGLEPAMLGLRPRHARNVLSLLRAALSHVGAISIPARLDVPLAPEWEALLKPVTEGSAIRLRRFGRYCTQEGIAPQEVDADVLVAFRQRLETESLAADPARCERETALHWNRAAAVHPGWPECRLPVPDNRLYFTPAWGSYPESLREDVQLWEASLSAGSSPGALFDDVLEGKPRRPSLKPATIKTRMATLRLLLGAQVLRGRPATELTNLSNAVEPRWVAEALTFFWERAGRKPTHHTSQIGRLAVMIARHWASSTGPDLEKLKQIAVRVSPAKTGMTARNRQRLHPFRDKDSNAYRLIDELPLRLCREVERELRGQEAVSHRMARQWQAAVLIGILTAVPLRLKNLAELHIGSDFTRKADGSWFISLHEDQTKNGEPVDVELDGPLADMITTYVKRFRCVLDVGGSAWLFPGQTPERPSCHDALRTKITATLAKRCGLQWHPHLFRHFAALRILLHHPGAYGLAQRVLGHKSLDMLMQHYSGLEAAQAHAHFQRLVMAGAPRQPRTARGKAKA